MTTVATAAIVMVMTVAAKAKGHIVFISKLLALAAVQIEQYTIVNLVFRSVIYTSKLCVPGIGYFIFFFVAIDLIKFKLFKVCVLP